MARYKTGLNTVYISEHMQEKLRLAAERDLTVVTAPMGYGKTTAVQWLLAKRNRLGDFTATVNVYSSDILLFWDSFRHAFLCTELWQMLSNMEFPVGKTAVGLLALLLSDYFAAQERQHFLFVDDCQLMQDPRLFELLLTLCDLPTDKFHLLIASRSDVLPPEAELRLGKRLLRITTEDLQLNQTELSVYAARCGINLDENAVKRLEQISEGWFSAAYLNLQAYQKTGRLFSEIDDINEMITRSLITPLSPRTQRFLEILSLADVFSVEQAAWMTQDADAAVLLNELCRSNAFVRCAADGKQFRLHHLLRVCMQRRFQTLPSRTQADCERRLAAWFLQQGESYYAALHYEKAGDWDRLLCAIDRDEGISFGPERLPVILDWLSRCPQELLLRHPVSIGVYMLSLFYSGQTAELAALEPLFQQSMQADTTLGPEERETLEGEVLLRLSFLRFNDIAAMGEYHRRIRRLGTQNRDPWTLGSPSILMLYHATSGALRDEAAEMQRCMPVYNRVSGDHGCGAAKLMLAEAALMCGEPQEAELQYQLAKNELKNGAWDMQLAAAFLAERIYALLPDEAPRRGLSALRKTLLGQKQFSLIPVINCAECWLCAVGIADGAEIAQTPVDEDTAFPLVRPIYAVTENQRLLSVKRWSNVAARVPALLARVQSPPYMLLRIYLLIQAAAANEQLGKRETADEQLFEAFSCALPDGILLPFAENAKYLQAMLPRFCSQHPAQIEKITELSDRLHRRAELPPQSTDIAVLSPREREIARLAAVGMGRQEISETLHLSEHTVKNHLTNIFEKLLLTGTPHQKRQQLHQYLDRLEK